MFVRLWPSRVRFFQAATLSGACVVAASFGQGCSGTEVEVMGAGASPTGSPMGDDPNANGGAASEPPPPANMDPVDEPEPPTSGNEGTGGRPVLDPPGAVSAGSAGSAPTPRDAGTPDDPPEEPPPVDPPADPPPEEPPPGEPLKINCSAAEGTLPGLKLTPIVTGLVEPTFVTAAPGDDTRLYVLEKGGTIRIVRNGQLLAEPFLNLSAFVETFNEQGLVGLAFHPNYAENGRFFVQYAYLNPARGANDPYEIVLSEFARSPDSPDRALEGEEVLRVVEQPASIHLAGMLAFGPEDGMLYISRGEGGTNESQDLDSRFGKLLRIDVDEEGPGLRYAVPEGNLRGEVWSYGLRNPWRFSFDACVGDIYIGDVGEASTEEINYQPAGINGANYGWKIVEGTQCFADEEPVPECDQTGLTAPVAQYDHDSGCSVTGGYVYRGTRIPGLRGTYLYADYCLGNFNSFRIEAGQAVDARDLTDDINPEAPDRITRISSFGVDNAGEMYVLSLRGGLYRIDPE